MNGSEKQIKWAQDIIESQKRIIESHLSNNRERTRLDGDKHTWLKLQLAAIEICCKHVLDGMSKLDNAKTIIDNRAVRYYVLQQVLPRLEGEEKATVTELFTQLNGKVNRTEIMQLLVG